MKRAIVAVLLAFGLQTPTGSIEGTVSLSGTDRPVANVEIRLGDKYRVTTDDKGRFALNDLPAGQYTVSIFRNGYVLAGIDNQNAMRTAQRDSDSYNFFGRITIGADEHIRDCHVELKPATGVVSGVVRNQAGAPVPNVAIILKQISYDMGRKVISPARYLALDVVKSDDRGNYRLFGLLPGEYLLAAVLPGISRSSSGREESWRNIYYPNAFYAENAVPVTVRDGEEIAHIDFTIHAETTPKISGIVVPPSPAITIAGLIVTPIPTNPDAVAPAPIAIRLLRGEGVFITPGATTPDFTRPLNKQEGQFTLPISDWDPGNYDLVVHAVTPDGDYYGTVPITTTGQSLDGVRVELRAGVELRGRASIQEGQPGLELSFPPVELKSTRNSYCESCSRNYINSVNLKSAQDSRATVAISEQPGSFTLSNIVPGEYFISPFDLPTGAFLSDVRQGDRSILGTAISIRDRSPEPIQVIIATGGPTIEGTLLNENKQGVGFSRVFLLADDAHRTSFSPYHVAYTDFRGRFRFGITSGNSDPLPVRPVPPREYKLYAWSNIPEGAWTNLSYMKMFQDLGTAIAVKSGENLKGVTVNLISK